MSASRAREGAVAARFLLEIARRRYPGPPVPMLARRRVPGVLLRYARSARSGLRSPMPPAAPGARSGRASGAPAHGRRASLAARPHASRITALSGYPVRPLTGAGTRDVCARDGPADRAPCAGRSVRRSPGDQTARARQAGDPRLSWHVRQPRDGAPAQLQPGARRARRQILPRSRKGGAPRTGAQ